MTGMYHERRRYLRLKAPLGLRIITRDNKVATTSVKNISPVGLRFVFDENVPESDRLELTLVLPGADNPVHVQGKIIWQKKMTVSGGFAYDTGIEFVNVEEDNKNTFLRFLCDLIYRKSGMAGANV
ncbi:MAG: PilZ domain-containing protein [Candidatus Omnitrophota bacterium]